jgi:regulator of cell morphogenesis and NO signaling
VWNEKKKEGEEIMSNLTYSEAKKKHFQTLKQYVPVVERVHGGNHPEFHVVRELLDAIWIKQKKQDQKNLN